MTVTTFEADVQRQHARYRIPLVCVIDGEEYSALDWSVAGIGIAGRPGKIAVGRAVPLRLQFPFDGFTLVVSLEAELRHADAKSGRAGFKYVNVTSAQQRMLRFVLDSYLAGVLVQAGEVLDVAGRAIEARSREIPQRETSRTTLGRARRAIWGGVRYAGIAAIAAALVVFLASSVYERVFVVPSASAGIVADLITVPAGANGRVTFVAGGSEVAAGEPIATVLSANGLSETIDSPCNCQIHARHANAESFVVLGEPILSLRQPDAEPYVAAHVPDNYLMNFYRGVTATIEYADGFRVTNARIRALPVLPDRGTADEGGVVRVALDPGRSIKAEEIGQPARVYFDTFPGSGLSGGTKLLARAAGVWPGSEFEANASEPTASDQAAPGAVR
jgi:alginate biosynthesis protein Alg44